ncbi:MAG: acyltransferase [Chloroflexi bacterium]|nr:acyltransferase [Chloroflexota bacterium]
MTKDKEHQATVDLRAEEIGDEVPRRGNRITRVLAILFMAAVGWRVTGGVPNLDKFIIVGAPHTSNWDFILVIATAMVIGIRISWMGKHSLFRGPLGPLFRWMGGIPVDRRATHGVVGENVSAFSQLDKLILCITPEGTRSKVREWKSGFYRIALGADVPIVLAAFDYKNKEVNLGPMLQPSGDYETDLDLIKAHYEPIRGKHPQNV